MQPIFTMQYGEYSVTEFLRKKANKKIYGKISVFIPASQQEKGIDLMLYKTKNGINKISTIQVKQSRTYYEDKQWIINGEEYLTIGGFWFNRYEVPENADWNILVGIYATNPKNKKSTVKNIKWETMMLAFTRKELIAFMNDVKTKNGKNDKFFGLSFDTKGNIFQTRGYKNVRCLNSYKIENRISEIYNF